MGSRLVPIEKTEYFRGFLKVEDYSIGKKNCGPGKKSVKPGIRG